MVTPTFVTGDDIVVPVTLKKDGVVFAINTSAVVKAALVRTSHENKLCNEVTQSNATVGANWATSLVVISIPSANTINLDFQGAALLEIQVDDSGKLTWFVPVNIVKGVIV